jgi:uncharacterized membrane protein
MTAETVSLKVAALMGVASAVLQNTGPSVSSNASFVIPIVSAIIGGIMSYAVLKTTVQKMEQDVQGMRDDMRELYTLVRDSMTKLAHLEGRVDASNH